MKTATSSRQTVTLGFGIVRPSSVDNLGLFRPFSSATKFRCQEPGKLYNEGYRPWCKAPGSTWKRLQDSSLLAFSHAKQAPEGREAF